MQLFEQNFPVLEPGQMSPFHQALQTGLANYKAGTEAAYLPSKLQADIASKAAYATYSPYSYLTKALSDPTTISLLAQNPQQFKAIMDKVATMPTNPYASLNQAAQGTPSVWDKMKEFIAGKGPSQQPSQAPVNMPVQPPTAQQVMEANGATSGAGAAGAGGDNANLDLTKTNTTIPDELPGIDLTSSRANLYGTDTGTKEGNIRLAKLNPSVATKAAIDRYNASELEKGKIAASTAGTTSQDWKNDAITNATAAQDAQYSADAFMKSYDQAWAKGAATGLPIGRAVASYLDPNARAAMNASNNLVLQMGPLLLGHRQTDYGKQLLGGSKLSIDMPSKTAHEVHDKQNLIFERAQELPAFQQAEEDRGITDINKQKRDWFEYNNKFRLLDKEGNLLSENVNKFADYLAGKSGATKATGKKSKEEEEGQEGQSPIEKRKVIGTTEYHFVNGTWRPVLKRKPK